MGQLLDSIGDFIYFGADAIGEAARPPFEWRAFFFQIKSIGWESLPLILASGLALGVVTTLHTRSTLVQFGAAALIPELQSEAFFNELGPLVTGLLVAGRAGAGIGAELANMRVTEQIDALETISVNSFRFLVVTRVLACTVVLPLLTVFMNFAGLLGGYLAEYSVSHISILLYLNEAFKDIQLANFLPPTLKTAVFGYLIGIVSCYFGFTINEGSSGVRRAATSSVVLSSLLIILADVLLVKIIFFLFPEQAL